MTRQNQVTTVINAEIFQVDSFQDVFRPKLRISHLLYDSHMSNPSYHP
jgi:hypothetical protein